MTDSKKTIRAVIEDGELVRFDVEYVEMSASLVKRLWKLLNKKSYSKGGKKAWKDKTPEQISKILKERAKKRKK